MKHQLNPVFALPASFPLARWWPLLGALGLACALGAAPGVASAQSSAPPAAGTASVAIHTAPLSTVWVQPERSAAAQVLARNEARLAAEVPGTVLRWYADVGQTVRAGQVLAQIDPTDLDLALRRAEAARDAAQARLNLAQSQLKRAQELVAQGFFSQEALSQRETEVALLSAERSSAQAQWQTAQRQRAKTTLRAPFAGTVTQRLAQTGEMLAPGSVLFVVTQTAQAEVSAQLPPAEVAGLRASPSVHFEADSGLRQPVAVRWLRTSAALQGGSRTQTVRLGFVQADATPPPGSSGVLRWRDPTPHLPPSLVVRRGEQLGVFVREGNQARFVPLPGAQEGRAAATTLNASTPIVVRGQASLRDGQPLN